MKPIAIINNDTHNRLHIGYIIGTTCNYKCHYCFDGCNDGQYRFPNNFDLVKNNFGHIIDLYKENFSKEHIRIHLTGGEPTLWPKLGEFAEFISGEKGCKISLSTNGSRTLNFWKKYTKYFDDIHISIHNESCNIDHLIEVMDWVYNNEPDVLINGTVLMDKLNWQRCVNIVEKLKSHPTEWLLKVRPVLINGILDQYLEEQLDFMRTKIKKQPPPEKVEHYKKLGIIQKTKPNVKVVLEDGREIKQNTFEVLENDWQHFSGWNCNLGIDRFTIERNGDIQGSCGSRKLFGLTEPLSIYDPDLPEKFTKDIVKGVICDQPYCICATDIRTTKYNVQLYRN